MELKPTSTGEFDFFSPEEKDVLPEKAISAINAAINRAYYKAIEEALITLPAVIDKLQEYWTGIQKIRENFLKENPDIEPKDPNFQDALYSIETEDPTRSPMDMLKEASLRVRKDRKSMQIADKLEQDLSNDKPSRSIHGVL